MYMLKRALMLKPPTKIWNADKVSYTWNRLENPQGPIKCFLIDIGAVVVRRFLTFCPKYPEEILKSVQHWGNRGKRTILKGFFLNQRRDKLHWDISDLVDLQAFKEQST